MSYRLKIRLAAEADVAEAAQWYNQRQLGLGEKLIREVDQAIARILENPLFFVVTKGKTSELAFVGGSRRRMPRGGRIWCRQHVRSRQIETLIVTCTRQRYT
jgi:plasmid stabilization system protein ParE